MPFRDDRVIKKSTLNCLGAGLLGCILSDRGRAQHKSYDGQCGVRKVGLVLLRINSLLGVLGTEVRTRYFIRLNIGSVHTLLAKLTGVV